MRPTRTAEALKFSCDTAAGSSGATLALLDLEAANNANHLTAGISPKRNGYLTVPTPPSSNSERSRSTSPLYLNEHNGFVFGSATLAGNSGASSVQRVLKPPMMRLVSKSGDCNVRHSNVQQKGLKYLADIFTTLVDCKWRWCALIFALGFFSTWLIYALIYFIFAWLHDDLDKTELQQGDWMPCINNIKDFTSAYLYSVETQHTIGYGYRFANTQCPHVIIVVCLQCLTGVALQAVLVGVLFAKLSRPKMRSETLMFSKEACICQRDGKLQFMFRIGDMRRSHIVEAHIRVICMKERVTAEGEEIPFYQYDVDVGFSDGSDRLFLVWPTIVSHVIDERSPFYQLSAEELKAQRMEVIVILEGIVEATGLTTQARTSYLPNEIRWGYRFEKVVRPFKDGSVRIDHDYFNKIYMVDSTPRCSAREVDVQQLLNMKEQPGADTSSTTTTTTTTTIGTLQLAQLPALLPSRLVLPNFQLAVPTQRYRRRQSTPIVSLSVMEAPAADPDNPFEPLLPAAAAAASEHLRRGSTPMQPSSISYQDPLSCSSGGAVLPLQTIELPRIR